MITTTKEGVGVVEHVDTTTEQVEPCDKHDCDAPARWRVWLKGTCRGGVSHGFHAGCTCNRRYVVTCREHRDELLTTANERLVCLVCQGEVIIVRIEAM